MFSYALTPGPLVCTLPKGEEDSARISLHSFAPAFVSRLRISTRPGSPPLLLSRANLKAVRLPCLSHSRLRHRLFY